MQVAQAMPIDLAFLCILAHARCADPTPCCHFIPPSLDADVEPTAGGPSPGGAGPSHAADQPAAAAAAQAGASGSFARAEQQGHGEDSSWVTVYGFTPDDLPLVLQEFQRCGDILQWGTFGSSPACNFTHIQYQNKYGAQRALMMSGRQLNSSLIIGVKQLEPQHRALVQAAGADGSPGPRIRAAAGPARPYRVELPAAQVLPRRATWHQKVSEYIFGM